MKPIDCESKIDGSILIKQRQDQMGIKKNRYPHTQEEQEHLMKEFQKNPRNSQFLPGSTVYLTLPEKNKSKLTKETDVKRVKLFKIELVDFKALPPMFRLEGMRGLYRRDELHPGISKADSIHGKFDPRIVSSQRRNKQGKPQAQKKADNGKYVWENVSHLLGQKD